VERKKLLQFHFILNQLKCHVVQVVQEVDNVVEEIVVDQIVMNNQDVNISKSSRRLFFYLLFFKLLHQIKANNQHHLNNMMTNKVHIEVDNVVVVVVVIIVVLIVAFVKVVQMLIQMHQHLIIQMIFPLFQNSKMVKLT